MGEYSVQRYAIGPGRYLGTITITTPDFSPGQTIHDDIIQHILQHEIAINQSIPRPTANTLYFIYLPPGITVIKAVLVSHVLLMDCADTMIAYRDSFFYAVMPYPNCRGCLIQGNTSAFDALTSTSSHELCEAITDPIPGMGWYDNDNGEIGDICGWKIKDVGTYKVQQEWSNRENDCV